MMFTMLKKNHAMLEEDERRNIDFIFDYDYALRILLCCNFSVSSGGNKVFQAFMLFSHSLFAVRYFPNLCPMSTAVTETDGLMEIASRILNG